MIDPLVAEGALPSFAKLAADGVQAELETVEPVNSPTVWTSIATGRSPSAHGISNFLQTALDRKVPTVFERLAAAGRRVGLYDYLVTWPPTALPNGFMIPGWTQRDAAREPPDVFARAGLKPPYRYSLDGLRLRDEYLENARRELARKAPQWRALARPSTSRSAPSLSTRSTRSPTASGATPSRSSSRAAGCRPTRATAA